MLHAGFGEPVDVCGSGRLLLGIDAIYVVAKRVGVIRLEEAVSLLQPVLKSLAFQQACTRKYVPFACLVQCIGLIQQQSCEFVPESSLYGVD